MFISWDRKQGPRNKSSCSAPLGVIIHLTSLGFPQEFGSKGNVLCRASWARKGFLVHPTDHRTNLPLLQLRCKRAIHTIISGMHFCFKDTIHWRLKTSQKIMIKSRSRCLMKTLSCEVPIKAEWTPVLKPPHLCVIPLLQFICCTSQVIFQHPLDWGYFCYEHIPMLFVQHR